MIMTVGIDISKDWLDVGRFPEAEGTRFPNTAAGHAALVAWLEGLGAAGDGTPVRVVFEATGAYHRGLARALERAGRRFCKVNPRRRAAALPSSYTTTRDTTEMGYRRSYSCSGLHLVLSCEPWARVSVRVGDQTKATRLPAGLDAQGRRRSVLRRCR